MEKRRQCASQSSWPVQRTRGRHKLGVYKEDSQAKGREGWGKEYPGEMIRPHQEGLGRTAGGLRITPWGGVCRGFRQFS